MRILLAAGLCVFGQSESGGYQVRLDRFEVIGPGAWSDGWHDDFNDNNPGSWTNMGGFGPIGNWHEQGEYAWLEGPGGGEGFPAYGVYWFRTTLFSYQIWDSFVSAGRGDFHGIATFADELPQLNGYSWLILNFTRYIKGKKYQEQIHVTITNYVPKVASILNLPGGLRIEQKNYLLDATTWKIAQTLDFRTVGISAPQKLGPVKLAIRYVDDSANPRFHAIYSLTDPPQGVMPFPDNPVPSSLHLSDQNVGWWSITSGVLVPVIPVDILPGSCPNPVNVKSRGLLPVAFLGTERIDTTIIDPATIELKREGSQSGIAPVRWDYQDVGTPFIMEPGTCDCHDLGGDGYLDLTLKFDTQELASYLGNVSGGQKISLFLTGRLKAEFGGTPVGGKDCIWVKRS
jgi:hypothetical protein